MIKNSLHIFIFVLMLSYSAVALAAENVEGDVALSSSIEMPEEPELSKGETNKIIRENKREIKKAVKTWVNDVWRANRRGFDKKKFEEIYDRSPRFVAFDQVSPSTTVIDGWHDYRRLWFPILDEYKSWNLSRYKMKYMHVGIDNAVTAFTFRSEVQHEDAEKASEASFHVTLVWHKTRKGWRIIHQHLSGPVRDSDGEQK